MSVRRGSLALTAFIAAAGVAAVVYPWVPALAGTQASPAVPPSVAAQAARATSASDAVVDKTLAGTLQPVAERGGSTKVDVLVMMAKGAATPYGMETPVRLNLRGLPGVDVYAGKVRASRLTKLATSRGVRFVADNGNLEPPSLPDAPRPTSAQVQALAQPKTKALTEATKSGAVRAWSNGFGRKGVRSDSGAAPQPGASAAIDPFAWLKSMAGQGSAEPGSGQHATGWFDVLANHRSSYAWAKGHTGKGVRVAVVDEGVDFAHPDLQGTEATVPAGPYAGWPMAFDPYSCLLLAYDDQHGSDYVSSGQSWFSSTTSAVAAGPAVAFDGHGYKTSGLPAASISGTYHIGYLNDENIGRLSPDSGYRRPAVLVADSTMSGVYDAVYVDLNFNRDFSDDKVCTRGGGTAPISYLDFWDSKNQFPRPDGYADLSGGMVYWIADGTNPPPGYEASFGSMSATPTAGTMVAFMGALDFMADHGTLCASNIAAQGRIDGASATEGNPAATPSFKGAGTGGVVQGAGRDVGVVAIGDMYNNYYMSALLSWNFCIAGPDDVPNSGDEVQIVSNSFGNSGDPTTEWDEWARYIDAINLLYAPKTTFMFSTGNGGPGYGTSAPPKATTGIAVGASTQFASAGYPFDSAVATDQITYGDVAPFSNRGPSAMGHGGVDVVADGAVASGDEPLNMVGDGWTAWGAWGGTSRSTPVAAGNLALAYQAYKDANGTWPTYEQARTFLMNGATDQKYDTFVQGAGRVDGERSADLAAGASGLVVTPSRLTPGWWRTAHYPGYASTLATGTETQVSLKVTALAPGSATLTSSHLVRSKTETFEVTLDPTKESPYSFQRPDYLKDVTADIPAGTDLVVFRVRMPLDQVDPSGSLGMTDSFNGIRSLVYDWSDAADNDGKLWNDSNGNGFVNDGEIQFGEYVRFNYANNDGATSEVRVQDPLSRKHTGVFFGLQHSQRLGNKLDVTVEMSCWKHEEWDAVEVPGAAISFANAGDSVDVPVGIKAPGKVGLYDGEILVDDSVHKTVVPVTLNVAAHGAEFSFGGNDATSALMPNDAVLGMQDWGWRAESGDWRTFMTDVPDETTVPPGGQWLVHTSWDSTPTDIDTTLLAPTDPFYLNATYNAFAGPGEMVESAGSASMYAGDGRWGFQTATGGSDEWVAGPLRKGLNEIRLHNVISDGGSLATTFTGQTGIVASRPSMVATVTRALSGTFPVTFATSMELPRFGGRGWGLSPVSDAMHTVAQDEDYTQDFTVQDGGYIGISLRCETSDLDLYLDYYDATADSWYTVAASEGSSGNESVRLVRPADGLYRVDVYGYSVTGIEDSFRLTMSAPQGSANMTLRGFGAAALAPGTMATGTATWRVDRSTLDARDAIYEGLVGLGPGAADQVSTVPVRIIYPFERYSSVPTPGQQGWSAAAPVSVQLSRRALASTVTTRSAYIELADHSPVPANVTYAEDTGRVTIAPTSILSRATTYTVCVTAAIRTLDGTPLQASSYRFKTGSQRVGRVTAQGVYGTAIAASRASFPAAGAVVIVSGDGYADAVAASGLCGALKAPLLLTPKNALLASVATEIKRLGATRVYIVGGTSVVSASVFERLSNVLGGGGVTRIAGATRYDTAGLVASKVDELSATGVREVIVVQGDMFQDALAVAAPAYARAAPVLFVPRGATVLPAATTNALKRIGAPAAYIVGGTSALTSQAMERVRVLTKGRTATRWAGFDAYATSAEVAHRASALGWLRWTHVGIATSATFQDGLAGGVATGAKGGPLMLTTPTALPSSVSSMLRFHRQAINDASIYGGVPVVSSKVDAQIAAALR